MMSDKEFEGRWGNFRDLVTHMFLEGQSLCPDTDVLWYPATDAYTENGEFVIRMDLSGVLQEDLQILMDGDQVQVRGVRREPAPGKSHRFHSMEIAKGPFGRTIRVPGEFAGGVASAIYLDGILEIRLRPPRRRAVGIIHIEITEGR